MAKKKLHRDGLKHCSKCHHWLALDCYAKDANRWDGLQHLCRECASVIRHIYCNGDIGRKTVAQYRKSDARKKVIARYIERNRAKLNDKTRIWRKSNTEHCAEVSRAWRQEHPGRAYELQVRYRNRKRINGGSHTKAEWDALCKSYKNKCAKCQQIKPLERDHIIPISKGGSSSIDNIQPLCKSCNSEKHIKMEDYRAPQN